MKKILDGNSATAEMAYKLSEMSFIYPITPSSPMAEQIDIKSNKNEKNIFNNKVDIVEMESEGGVAGSVHGSLLSGELTTTFTCSQGLLLMIPNMYKIAGELLPTVFHISARALATHALSIFGDHSDVMAIRQTGFAMLCSSNPQEAYDFALASHIATLKSSIPFAHFFDGFRTSHEITNVETIDDDKIKSIYPYDDMKKFKARAIGNLNPVQHGTAQNPDVFFQNREACNKYYDRLPSIMEQTFEDIYKITGRKYASFEYVGNPNAEYVLVAMGSSCDAIETTINALKNDKIGLIKVRLFRPFDIKRFVNCLPKNVKTITVLDRTKECGSIGEPLYEDVCSCLKEQNINATILGGRYGLGGKDFSPKMIKAIVENMTTNENKNHFTVGINDDVTNHSLKEDEHFEIKDDSYSCKFFGLGSDGTVSANKNTIKIIGENTNLYSQGYFVYDSKKSGSVTTSHLRFSASPIKKPYLISRANFIGIHNQSFIKKFDCFKDIKENGTILLNTDETVEQVMTNLPDKFKNIIANRNAKLYIIDANKIAHEHNLKGKINVIMQTAFFYLSNIMDFELCKEKMKSAVRKSYIAYGEEVVNNNIEAMLDTQEKIVKIDYPSVWKNAKDLSKQEFVCESYNNYIKPILELEGDNLPVSAFSADGLQETGTSKLEKREVASSIPEWIPEKCIQCGQCSMVCPHASIRPFLIDENNMKNAPKDLTVKPAIGVKGKQYRIQVYPQDCTGCENCVKTCPTKALAMKSIHENFEKEKQNLSFLEKLPKEDNPFPISSIKGSQFQKPYFEFSGACAGCGETPYIKLLTQLFGDRMLIANATGCSSIYGGSNPTCPYAKDEKGHGPSWCNSLFEDNAEFGLGIRIAYNKKVSDIKDYLKENLNEISSEKIKTLTEDWLNDNYDNKSIKVLVDELKNELENKKQLNKVETFIKDNLDALLPKSVWIIGGDGWAYDIGYGGLDHVLASGENIKVLVLDSEVYSNTGGQSSKSTPLSAIARFKEAGKNTNKKNLGMLAMTYGNVYVAQVAMGADKNQVIKAFTEAENYNGPAIIIAYATCINHGIKNDSMQQMKNAVLSGYWNLYRYNPDNIKTNKNPFTLDSKEPTMDYVTHLMTEKRFINLQKNNPERAKELFEKAKEFAKHNYTTYKKLSE